MLFWLKALHKKMLPKKVSPHWQHLLYYIVVKPFRVTPFFGWGLLQVLPKMMKLPQRLDNNYYENIFAI
jgi:hypothetical protein